jgi:iron complex transport system permease protein
MQRWLAFALFPSLALASLAAGLLVGSVPLSLDEFASALRGEQTLAADIVWRLRAPRVAAAFCAGGLLAVAGAFMQALLRNPLADPYLFGVSGGAALGALVAMAAGLGGLASAAFGFGGAAAVALIVALLALRARDWNPYRLLLSGVVVAAGLNAVISLLLILAPGTAVKGLLFWLMGDFGHSRVPATEALLLAVLIVFGFARGQPMNVLGIGRMKAASLGVEVTRLESMLYLGAAAATAAAVLLGGTIGFIGLIVPHLCRLLGVHDHRALVPLSALLGGSLLVLADTAARSLWAPVQLPAGILTALIGVPLLLALISARPHAAR